MLYKVATPVWATEVCKRLNLERKQLIALIKAGKLTQRRDFYGRRYFDDDQVKALSDEFEIRGAKAAKNPPDPERPKKLTRGTKAAVAFELFRDSTPLRDVVVALELTPSEALELRQKYAELGADVLLAGPDLELVRELLDWRGSTGADLAKTINDRLRYQYDRGRKNSDNERTTVDDRKQSSPKIHKRGGGDALRREGSFRRDEASETDSSPGIRSQG